jgi:hypothetical protein
MLLDIRNQLVFPFNSLTVIAPCCVRAPVVRKFLVCFLDFLVQAFAFMVNNRTFSAVIAALSGSAIGIADIVIFPAVFVLFIKRTDGEKFDAANHDAGTGKHLVLPAFVDERRIAGRPVVDMMRL